MKNIIPYILLLILVLTACNIKPSDNPNEEETLLQAEATDIVEATEELTDTSITPQPTFTPISSSSVDTADTVQSGSSVQSSTSGQSTTNTQTQNTVQTSNAGQSGGAVQSVNTVQCTPRTDWPSYIVKRGDTLFNIAQRANSDVATVAAGNCLDDASNISVGQAIRIPNVLSDDEFVMYWNHSDVQTDGTVVVGCESFLTPVRTGTLKTSDPANNIRNSLNALFNAPASDLNYWNRLSLRVESVSVDNSGRATIRIAGDVILIGTCGDAVMSSQIWYSVFSEPSVQTAYITANGRNLVQVFDMSGLSSADAVFTRANSPVIEDNPTTCTPRTDWFNYTVQRGDTLFSIAQRVNSNVATLTTGNCLADASNISVGQVLLVPNEIASSDYVMYWLPTQTQGDASVVIGCEQIVSPIPTDTVRTGDAASNIQTSLNALFNAPPALLNYWDDGDDLVVQSVSIDEVGLAAIAVSGDVVLAGACSDALMRAQILLTAFAEPEVQRVFITFNGQNFANLIDGSGTIPAGAVFTRADIGYANQ